jgi:hypothetical protein
MFKLLSKPISINSLGTKRAGQVSQSLPNITLCSLAGAAAIPYCAEKIPAFARQGIWSKRY